MTDCSDLHALIASASGLEEGAEVAGALREALLELIARRRRPEEPPIPALSALVVRREGLPEWWGRANLLLTASGVAPNLTTEHRPLERAGNLAILGAAANVGRLSFAASDGLIVVGDGVSMMLANLSARNGGAILLGAGCTAKSWARVDARNGGAVLVGEDGMWAPGVNLVTDDMHAICDLESGRRVNAYGGRIVVERHVWLCEEARLVGGARVGADSVVGFGALVRSTLPAGAVSVGAPARAIRHGVTWAREDLP